jgi:hypothetical protein
MIWPMISKGKHEPDLAFARCPLGPQPALLCAGKAGAGGRHSLPHSGRHRTFLGLAQELDA